MSPIRVGTDHRVQRACGIGGAAAEFDGDCPVLQLKLTFSGRPTEAPAVGVEHLRIRIRGACAKGLTTGGAVVSTCTQAKAIKSGANAKGLTRSRARAREGGHQGSSGLIRAHQCSPHLKAQAGEGGLLLDVERLPLLELGTEPVLTCGERRRSEHLHRAEAIVPVRLTQVLGGHQWSSRAHHQGSSGLIRQSHRSG